MKQLLVFIFLSRVNEGCPKIDAIRSFPVKKCVRASYNPSAE